jgi:hypothetical protein
VIILFIAFLLYLPVAIIYDQVLAKFFKFVKDKFGIGKEVVTFGSLIMGNKTTQKFTI